MSSWKRKVVLITRKVHQVQKLPIKLENKNLPAEIDGLVWIFSKKLHDTCRWSWRAARGCVQPPAGLLLLHPLHQRAQPLPQLCLHLPGWLRRGSRSARAARHLHGRDSTGADLFYSIVVGIVYSKFNVVHVCNGTTDLKTRNNFYKRRGLTENILGFYERILSWKQNKKFSKTHHPTWSQCLPWNRL